MKTKFYIQKKLIGEVTEISLPGVEQSMIKLDNEVWIPGVRRFTDCEMSVLVSELGGSRLLAAFLNTNKPSRVWVTGEFGGPAKLAFTGWIIGVDPLLIPPLNERRVTIRVGTLPRHRPVIKELR